METELKKREALRLSNEESNKLTRECIRTALLYLMADNPYDKITVTQIIRRSGVSRAGFYRNYASKDDVLDEILDLQYQTLQKSVDREKLAADPVGWFTEIFRNIEKDQSYLRLFMNARQPVPMQPGKRPGEVLFDESLPARERYRDIVFRTAMPFIFVQWFLHGMKETPEEMGKICAELYENLR